MTTRTRAELILLGTTVIWGSTFVVTKIGLEDLSALFFVGLRFSLAALFFLSFFWKRIFPLSTSMIIRGFGLGLLLFIGFITQTIGLHYTTASKSAFITGMMVVFVPVLQVVIEKKIPRLGNILGVVVVTAGLWLLTSPTGAAFNIGDALTMVCAVSFGFYIIYLDMISREMTSLQLTFLQTGSNAVYALIGIALFGGLPVTFSSSSVYSVLYLTIFATIFTTFAQTRFQKDTTPTKAVVIFSVEPVIATVLASMFLGEEPGTLGVVGGGLILSGVLISELSESIPFLDRPLYQPSQHQPF